MWLDVFMYWCAPWRQWTYPDYWKCLADTCSPGALGIGGIPAQYAGC
jgi:hypothetical protein